MRLLSPESGKMEPQWMDLEMGRNPREIKKTVFSNVFKKALSLWPLEIDVTEKKFFPNGRARIPLLSKAHHEVQRRLASVDEDEDLAFAVDWAIFTVLHTAARSADELQVSEVATLERVQEKFAAYEDWKLL